MKNNKWMIVVLFVLSGVLLAFFVNSKQKITEQKAPSTEKSESSFLINGYPINQVPLFKLNKVSSNKIFVNTDPTNTSEFDETNFAYFNVVFYSDASQEEFLNYYKNLFDSLIADESENRQMVKGNIGQYKVSAAHYGIDNTGYIQVHLPNYADDSLNEYFLEFPEILKNDTSFIEHEKSYGLLNQKGGEVEYTKYFTVIDSGDKNNDGQDDVDEFLAIEEKYIDQYKDNPAYSYIKENETMEWQEGKFKSSLVFSRNHGRIYLMLRKNMDI